MRRSVPHDAPEVTYEDIFTPTRVWPWTLGLVVLEALLVLAAWVHTVGPGANSRPSPAPTPGPGAPSFSQDLPAPEPLPGVAPQPPTW